MKTLHFSFLGLQFLTLGIFPLVAVESPPLAFPHLKLIEEIDLTASTKEPGHFKEYPAGISRVETLLDRKARVLPNDQPGIKYFGVLVGAGKGLKGRRNYVLEIEYPEDKPRSILVLNRGNEMNRGFHTGNTTGDAIDPLYVNNAPESLELPLSGTYETSQTLMFLQDRTSEVSWKRGAKIPEPSEGERTRTPEDGFWVYIAQFEPNQDPLSHGAAVSKIRLYEASAFDPANTAFPFPPEGLPLRHLFFREEMADNVIDGDPSQRGFDDPNEWYVGKAQLMRALSMNTFSKDLLEFGANQGWDSSRFGGDRWVYQSKFPGRWEHLVDTAKAYGLSVLPYYEYAGSKGQEGLGPQKRAIPLSGDDYTHIRWGESSRADLTDPDTFEDFRKMLELTVVDLKDRAHFVGAWLRPRASQLPISFSDAALNRFSQTRPDDSPVTREDLKKDKSLYASYRFWWFDQRKRFIDQVRDYLRDSGVTDAMVLYTADPSEPGRIQPGGAQSGLVAEDPSAWKDIALKKPPVPLAQAIKERWSFLAQTTPQPTWGKWEWQHAAPEQDPEAYRNDIGVLPTYTFNRAYTVADPAALEAFTTPSGLAMIRHFSLNENMLQEHPGEEGKALDPLGYFVADFERAGPFSMLPEARAMANGNPTFLGYLSSNNFNRSFPDYARAFNAAFLSLPALPSEKLTDAASDPEVVVRRIDGGKDGTWLAVVNPGTTAKNQVAIRLPVDGSVINAVTGEALPATDGRVTLDLYPCQLVSLRIMPTKN